LPVDWYNGGMEHTTFHLLYSRFWHKFLYDIGVVTCKEPYAKRTSHGMILGENGEKMSKSRGNVVNPDDIVNESGADTMRLYEMFIGDFEKAAPWSATGVKGCKRFLDRIWNLQDILVDGDTYSKELEVSMNKTIKKVTEDIENLKFNTAIAAMMALLNDVQAVGKLNKAEYRSILIMLNPFAPHITEELYELCGFDGLLSSQKWVTFDEAKCKDDTVELAVQVNGKIKAKISLPTDCDKNTAIATAKADEKVQEAINGKDIVKEIVVPNKLVNIVVK
ncbi:MAG: class I tRNA ligase family protein, partial [Oscillospiraceae bacterium]